jgi:hypothetical protein
MCLPASIVNGNVSGPLAILKSGLLTLDNLISVIASTAPPMFRMESVLVTVFPVDVLGKTMMGLAAWHNLSNRHETA